ncbi:MAG: hypothetical protein GQ574_27955 [Crocinitomix sp.]|nr:hypothetical protein [Crocinitomix sp.]
MKKKIWMLGMGAILLASCGGTETNTDTTETNNETTDTTSTEIEEDVVENGPIDPFPDFPKGGTSAATGDYILTPSLGWQQDATSGEAADQTFIFYKAKMSEAGDGYSKVDFTFDGEQEIPNYMIVPIKPSQTAKKGDIILTWWQSGSGMKRAIVTDDSNPAEPEVNYIDIDWDNPATTTEGVGFGQRKETIKPGSFHVLTSEWEPGTTVAVKKGADYKVATIIAVSGDHVLTCGFGGKMAMYSKSECTALPVVPNVRVGDMVQAPWVGTFKSVKVQKIDKVMGRIWTDDPFSDEPMVIAFGDIATNLPIQ